MIVFLVFTILSTWIQDLHSLDLFFYCIYQQQRIENSIWDCIGEKKKLSDIWNPLGEKNRFPSCLCFCMSPDQFLTVETDENSTALQYDSTQFRPSNGNIFNHFSKQPSSELPSVLGAQPLVHIRHNSFDQPEFHGFRPRAYSSPGRNDISFESLASAIPFEDSGYGAHSLAADFEDLTGRSSDRESRKCLNETVEADAVDDSFDSAQKTK